MVLKCRHPYLKEWWHGLHQCFHIIYLIILKQNWNWYGKAKGCQRIFSNFKEALYVVDVTFQHSFRPSRCGSMEAGKRYFQGKHKLYGYEIEVCMLPNGLAFGCTQQHHDLVLDFEIFQCSRDLHENELRKKTVMPLK